MPIEIKNRFTGQVICTGETVREAALANLAYLSGAYLSGADLSGVDLSGADLRGADLRDAYLRGADLSGVDLSGADLRGAYLRGADLSGADLRGADLSGADLRDAYLSGAYLSGADLRGAKIAWQSHDLLSELLRRAAGDEIEKLKVAGLLLVCREKCWKEFIAMRDREPLFDWAMEELAKWVQPDDGAPEILRELVTKGD